MPVKPLWLRIQEAGVSADLETAMQEVEAGAGDLVLDFSSVRRIDAGALTKLEKLAGLAGDKPVKVALHGVNVDIYKVLKLTKLSPRFSFT